ncbi:hypothetical protein Zmor_009201 [Zophobas morio]|uniref:4-nitrophenylphosphatase n=1 Tax=Zophobas morio TaxID=2755281 RepID=A0AA38IM41_9CUCU|nr:hypothetical protein Zmor_009201 [Zophobas morio]
MKDLNALNTHELRAFFDSFDHVLCDVHGVLWNVLETIPGAAAAVASLQNLGKTFIVVSNNTTATLDDYHHDFTSKGFPIKRENIVTPIQTTISYLKKQNFSKEVFVLGTHPLKKSLRDAGFRIAERGPLEIKETFHALAAASTEDDGSVGAVVADIDLNVNYVNLQKAVTFLKRPEVIFIRGTGDARFGVGLDRVVMGPGVFHAIVEECSGREPVSVAKPAPFANEFIVEKYKIGDASRVLFIGDSIPSDMGFATKFGYKKLLVLSGLTKEGALEDWKFPEEYRPDYFVDSLKSVHDLIGRI